MKIFYSMFLTILLAINCTGYIASEISKPIRDSEMHKIESEDITQYYYTPVSYTHLTLPTKA